MSYALNALSIDEKGILIELLRDDVARRTCEIEECERDLDEHPYPVTANGGAHARFPGTDWLLVGSDEWKKRTEVGIEADTEKVNRRIVLIVKVGSL